MTTFQALLFLSTLSLRRATPNATHISALMLYFYPRSPCGERRSSPQATMHTWKFLSTLSLRRATLASLSAVLTEHFYPRSPCGERLRCVIFYIWITLFLSTLSLRRATKVGKRQKSGKKFLSTLSLRRATSGTSKNLICTLYFYPRSPCGERR